MAIWLITGGAGFIGSRFIARGLTQHPGDEFINLDAMTYAAHPATLKRFAASPNYRFVQGDVANAQDVENVLRLGVDFVVHFAAESHVDRSIVDSREFIRTNVVGTHTLLEAIRRHPVRRFVHVSTDEVYGSLPATGKFVEDTALHPNNPYSASKAAADLLVGAYSRTYGVPAQITRCSNNFGPYQFPEKLIPRMITQALQNKPVSLYGDGLNIRDWLYVDDHCRAIDFVLQHGQVGEVYNVGCDNERTNLEVARLVLHYLNKPESLIQYVDDRPGHDRRYATDASKITRELGWTPQYSFQQALLSTVRWYVANEWWWRPILSGTYHDAEPGGARKAGDEQ
ncbi:dTDP-glucose 4,6-dehydratase [Alicyclobacillus sp. ALC3]|uniref:dTDP-glucose 4,6-dehydratase n=1 Tax=Alicyclobacillus sp. ALC3 TaxID=2796143 RepID=UPI002378D19F|nr:dTDP-glucose 4,6-dehydratase [Alicyclobacillus sp. ALC3]WDL95159.1 dTDP-glucose 4,6-dehydratase [Alicyclobacillus sp. ALC3]